MVAIFIVNKYIFLFFVVSIILLFWFRKTRMAAWFEASTEWRKQEEINTSLITEIIRGLRDIKVLNASKNITKVMNEKLSESFNKRMKTNMRFQKYKLFATVARGLIDLFFVMLAIYLTKADLLTTTNFIILYMYSSRVYTLLDYMAEFTEVTKVFNVAAGRTFELLDEEKYFWVSNTPPESGAFDNQCVICGCKTCSFFV